MKTLDAHGDDYRNAQLTILLEVSLETNTMWKNVNMTFLLTYCIAVIILSITMQFYIPKAILPDNMQNSFLVFITLFISFNF